MYTSLLNNTSQCAGDGKEASPPPAAFPRYFQYNAPRDSLSTPTTSKRKGGRQKIDPIVKKKRKAEGQKNRIAKKELLLSRIHQLENALAAAQETLRKERAEWATERAAIVSARDAAVKQAADTAKAPWDANATVI